MLLKCLGTATVALGSSGKTFSSSDVESITSQDLSSYLTAGEQTIFNIGTTIDGADYEGNPAGTYARTGIAQATLNVIGFLAVEETEEENEEEVTEEDDTSEQEYAITLVETTYGSSDDVYFICEGTDEDGRYIISVIDNETDEVLKYYYVDITTDTVTET